MSKKSKNKERKPSSKKDSHHILFQGSFWKEGYAKILREHPYMSAYINRDTTHKEIHNLIHDIPMPSGKECKKAYMKLLEYELQRKIDVFNDSILDRIQFLINVWKDTCPATVAVLRWQQNIIRGCNEQIFI